MHNHQGSSAESKVKSPGLFLDRDGTLIVHKPYLCDPAGVELLPGVIEGLQAARAAGFKLFLFTNQSGIGRGWFTLAQAEAVNTRMLELLGLGDDLFTDICIAPEAPDQPAVYRKPSPRYILEMMARYDLDATRSWMIGDSLSDWEAGLAAGIRAAAVRPSPPDDATEKKRLAAGIPLLEEWTDLLKAEGCQR